MNAEQYRALVNRLEQISEADEPTAGASAGIDDATRQRAMDYVKNNGAGATEPAPADTAKPQEKQGATNIDAYKPNDGLKDVPGNSKSQAIANARKMGMKAGDKFRWCMTYKVQGAVGGQAPMKTPHDTPWKQAGGAELPLPPGYTQESALSQAVNSLRAKLNELRIGDIDPQTGRPITGGLTNNYGELYRGGDYGQGPQDTWNKQLGDAPKPPAEPDSNVTVNPIAPPGPIETNPVPPVAPVADPIKDPIKDPVQTTCDIEAQARIKYMPTFNQAYAAAKKAGCPEFQWCQVVTIQAEQAPLASEPGAAVGNTTLGRQAANHWGRLALQHKSANDPYGLGWLKQAHPDLLDPKQHTAQEISSLTNMITSMGQGKDKWDYIQR